ncbi:MAG: C39 family peptidase [Candidatus Kerfeldbacteria bacterium]|nr:C39 family peptidase [Candidatus Kerfeldbacteria bacterium]
MTKQASWFYAALFCLTVCFPLKTLASDVAERTAGRVLLQVEQHGEAWYVNPADQERYYLGKPKNAFRIMKHLGVGITDANLALIPQPSDTWDGDATIMHSVRGKIVLQVEQHGEAWYVNPVDGKRYYLGRPRDAWQVMTRFGLGITDSDLNQIERNTPKNALPASVLLTVPFTSQAPYGNWGSPYDEACEEASLAMVEAFLRNQTLSAGTANQRILEIVDWEVAAYGYHADTSAEVTATTARGYLGFDAIISPEVTKQQIKKWLSQGKPVIAPVYGKALNNPHYRNGGPYYHMMVIIGYDGNDFITNDPGTMYGEHYRYNADLFVSAIHDLGVPESSTATATPVVVVVRP